MTGPKHLWSGNWQEESEAASDERTSRVPEPQDEAPTLPRPTRPQPTSPRPKRPPRRRKSNFQRAVPVALLALLFVAVAAWGVSALVGSSDHKTSPPPHAATPTPPAATSPPPGPTTPPSATTSPPPTTTTPPPATAPSTPAIASARPVSWLGMQIETLPPGAAVIETVKLGSEGDRAGLEPGDVIVAINNQPINAASGITTAIQGLHRGDQIPIQISHGSTLDQTTIILAAPPLVHP